MSGEKSERLRLADELATVFGCREAAASMRADEAEIARRDAEIEQLRDSAIAIAIECENSEGWKQAAHWRQRAETAEQELARSRVDAERYAWLRSDALMYEDGNNPTPWCVTGTSSADCEPTFGDELDAAVDAAMGAG